MTNSLRKYGGKWTGRESQMGKVSTVDIDPGLAFTGGTLMTIHKDKLDIVEACQSYKYDTIAESNRSIDEAMSQWKSVVAQEYIGAQSDLNQIQQELNVDSSDMSGAENAISREQASDINMIDKQIRAHNLEEAAKVVRTMTVSYSGDAEAVFSFWGMREYFVQMAWQMSNLVGPDAGEKVPLNVRLHTENWLSDIQDNLYEVAKEILETYSKMFEQGGFDPKWEKLCKVTIQLRQTMPEHITSTGVKGGRPVWRMDSILIHTGRMAGLDLPGGSFRIVSGEPDSIGIRPLEVKLAMGTSGYIFRVHEYGATIMVTPNMRAFLHGMGIHLRGDVGHITIPRRPMIEPLMKRVMDNMKITMAEIGKRAIALRAAPATISEKSLVIMSRVSAGAETLLATKQWSMADYRKWQAASPTVKYEMVHGVSWPYKWQPMTGYSSHGYTRGG